MTRTANAVIPSNVALQLRRAIDEELAGQLARIESSEVLNRAEDYSTYVLMNESPAHVVELAARIEAQLNTGYAAAQLASEITRMLAGIYRQYVSSGPEVYAG